MQPIALGSIDDGGRAAAIAMRGNEAWTLDALLDLRGDAPSAVACALDWARWRGPLREAVEDAGRRGIRPVDLSRARFLTPVPHPPKIVCVGVNYRDHLDEMGVTAAPEFPYAFLRPATCLAAHGGVVPLPAWPAFIDWEAELGVVIGRRCRNLSRDEALGAVAAYTIVNDVSARDWIERRPFVGIDWVMQKAWDSFQPTGPWLVPADFVPDPQNLAIELAVNGEVKQASNTSRMIFDVPAILEHLSAIMTLEPGDLIATGTPAGVGFGRVPRESLRAGDVVRVSVEGLGVLENTFA